MIKGYDCPNCGVERSYKSISSVKKFKDRNCRSCTNSIKKGGRGIKYNSKGERLCSSCEAHPSGWNSYCNPCNVEKRKEYWSKKMRYDRYGITKKEYEDCLKKQNYTCFSCDSKENLCIDHCHTTGKFRGILCNSCNTALGLLYDNTNTLNKLILYLQN